MKKISALLVIAALAMACGCATYTMKLTTGQSYEMETAPEYVGKKRMFYYENEKGKKVMVPAMSVESIKVSE